MNFVKALFRPCARRKSSSANGPRWLGSSEALNSLVRLAESQVTEREVPELVRVCAGMDLKNLKAPKTSGQVGYIPLIEGSEFTLCAFFLPQGTMLPYHDHPGMHVGLRVLFGEIEIRSVDIIAKSPVVGESYPITSESRKIVTPESEISVVRPDKANIHQISAVRDSMFLDLVLPPYSPGRTITYFKRNGELLNAVRERDVNLYMQCCDVNSLVV